MKKSVEISQKTNNITIRCDAVISLLSIYPRKFKGGSTRDICTPMYIVALFPKACDRW